MTVELPLFVCIEIIDSFVLNFNMFSSKHKHWYTCPCLYEFVFELNLVHHNIMLNVTSKYNIANIMYNITSKYNMNNKIYIITFKYKFI